MQQSLEFHELLRTWAAAILLLISTGWTIYWSVTMYRRSAVKSEQDNLIKRISRLEEAVSADEKADGSSFAKMEGRLQQVEQELKHMPTRDQFYALSTAMSEMKGDIRELSVSIRPLAASVERIDNFLMERAKG